MEIQNKVALVTGAGSGIGRALAEKLAMGGARAVVCADLNGANAEETAMSLGGIGTAATLDVGDEEALNALIDHTEQTTGGIDLMVSNAGYAAPGGLELTTEVWENMMRVHTWAHLFAARAVLPGMARRGGGYLLNTASAAGLLTQMDSAPYAVSKHAAVALAEWIAINHYDEGIRVSVLCPQAVHTNIGAGLQKTDNSPAKGQASFDGVLEPDVVADACLDAVREERFLVLPHPEVAIYFQRKANDYDRWLRGMRRFWNMIQNQ